MAERWSKLALAAGAWAISAAALAAPPSAAMLSNACAGCHGTHGASAGPSMPTLAGQDKDAIVESMKDFKSGKRPSTIMGRLAKGYRSRTAPIRPLIPPRSPRARNCTTSSASAVTSKTARKARTAPQSWPVSG
jgi:hypothetical protein